MAALALVEPPLLLQLLQRPVLLQLQHGHADLLPATHVYMFVVRFLSLFTYASAC